ncbi:MAG TPA: transglutaminase-like domain-containing protein [Kofleriaceae bacterium]|nr:transglutaminase-like domain-containing protein [Kofleriaceae bacterium]
MTDALQRFADAVSAGDDAIALDRAALLVGELEGELDLARYLGRIDELAARASDARDRLGEVAFAGPRAIAAALFHELGFRGNTADYYDPDNSFLHRVLDRRTGIPITLSVLYMEVARRIGVAAAGLGFPGHFLVRVDSQPRDLIIDPFHGGAELDGPALTALLQKMTGPEAKVEPQMLAPLSNGKILTRVLLNLAGIYGQRGDWFRSLEVLERLAILDADNPKIARDLEQLRARVDGLN